MERCENRSGVAQRDDQSRCQDAIDERRGIFPGNNCAHGLRTVVTGGQGDGDVLPRRNERKEEDERPTSHSFGFFTR